MMGGDFLPFFLSFFLGNQQLLVASSISDLIMEDASQQSSNLSCC